MQLIPFPKQYLAWKSEKCVLVEPLDGIIRSHAFQNGYVMFKVRIPTATKVAVIVEDDDNKHYQMTKCDGEWVVQVYLMQYFGKEKPHNIKVSAMFPNQQIKPEDVKFYTTLLEYSIE